MALGVAGVAVKDDVAVDLAEGGCRCGKGGQDGAVDGGGAVGPGQGLREVPQDLPGVLPGGGDAVAEDLVAAVQDVGAGHIDEDGGIDGGDDVDAVELGQRQAGAVQVGAVQLEDVQSLIGAGEVELAEHHGTGTVGLQRAPEEGSAFQVALRLGKVDRRTGGQGAVGVAHGVVDYRAGGADDGVAAGVGAAGHVDGAAHHKGRVGACRRQRGDACAHAVVAQHGVVAHGHPALCVGVAQAQIAEYEYVIVIGKAKVDCHNGSSHGVV